MKTIEQQNAMIAEFMGCTFEYKKTDKAQVKVVNGLLNFIPDWRRKIGLSTSGVTYLPVRDLKFNTSWDWLMPVVEKIEKYNDSCALVIIEDERCHIDTQNGFSVDSTSESKILSTYNAVCQFIEFYNANK